MEKRGLRFPENFYWGTATSAYQVEGGIRNDWSEAGIALHQNKFDAGQACDHYHRFREDFDLAKQMHNNAHRFSIEWARIQPEEGKFDQKEIEHYREVILALKQRGLEPFVTLWHWTNPLWIRDIGGWENKKTIKHFLKYVAKVVREYKTQVKFWVPLNEPNSYIGLGYVMGTQPPQIRSLFRANRTFKNLMQAYLGAYKLIHSIQSNSQVGASHFVAHQIPYKNLIWNRLIVKIIQYYSNNRFFNQIKDSVDFLGIQYYESECINLKIGGARMGIIEMINPKIWASDLGWEICPEGIYFVLKQAVKYNKPVFITENGVADAQDFHRVKFIKEHLRYILKAISEGVDVRGYFHWSLLDNFEMPEGRGFWPRFGLIEIDYDNNLKRIPRSSSRVYAEICKSNAIDV